MNSKISLIMKGIITCALLSSCASKQIPPQANVQVSFVTVHHSVLHIPVRATYQWSTGFSRQVAAGRLHDVDMWGLLKQGIEAEMQAKGYRKIGAAEQADIHISFVAALASALDDAEIQRKYGLVPGLMVHQVDKRRYEKGTLIFDVVNPKTHKLAWRTAGQALATLDKLPVEDRKVRIAVFVKKLLAFLPET
jgi:hypothetical protein